MKFKLLEASTPSTKGGNIFKQMQKYKKDLKTTNYEDDDYQYSAEVEEREWLNSLTYKELENMDKSDRDDIKSFCKYRGGDNPNPDNEYSKVYEMIMYIEEGESEEYLRSELKDLYDSMIKGHTEAEYELGSKVYEFEWNREKHMTPEEKAEESSMELNDKMNKMIQEFVEKNPQYSAHEAAQALSLVYACEEYSDLYKDIYHVRPGRII